MHKTLQGHISGQTHTDKLANVSAHSYANQAISKYVRKRRAESLFFQPPAKN